ncbi:MAG: Cof-type HAD-IIB family hydrolase [Clostridia bacterium]|nr:Cof-type HAD-IIB family hydrolase [Clostridia bacterium]
MAEYRIVASDLDGTLLDSNLRVGEKNLAAIEKMYNSGVFFVPASGRALGEFPEEVKNNPFIRYIITSNGAAIIDKLNGVTDCLYLSEQDISEIYKITDKYTAFSFTHTDGEDYIDKKDYSEEAFYYYGAGKEYKEIVLDVSHPVDNLRKFIKENPTELLVFFFKYSDERIKCMEELRKIAGITVTTSCEGNIEIINSQSSKGNALKRLSALTGIDTEKIIAVGDNYNDISFTETAGLSLAVKNAVEAYKLKADKVICSNNDGIADYIYNNFIEK